MTTIVPAIVGVPAVTVFLDGFNAVAGVLANAGVPSVTGFLLLQVSLLEWVH